MTSSLWTSALLMVNGLSLLASAGFGVLALRRPEALSGKGRRGQDDGGPAGTAGWAASYYVQMYAARTVPFGLVATAVIAAAPEQAPAWLAVAGIIQALDAWIGRGVGDRRAVIAPAIGAAVHLASALYLALSPA